MSWTEALFLHALVLIGCLIGGVNIGAAMGIAGLVVITITSGVNLWPTLGDLVWNTTTDFNLAAVPLFILMSELVLQSGIASRFSCRYRPGATKAQAWYSSHGEDRNSAQKNASLIGAKKPEVGSLAIICAAWPVGSCEIIGRARWS